MLSFHGAHQFDRLRYTALSQKLAVILSGDPLEVGHLGLIIDGVQSSGVLECSGSI